MEKTLEKYLKDKQLIKKTAACASLDIEGTIRKLLEATPNRCVEINPRSNGEFVEIKDKNWKETIYAEFIEIKNGEVTVTGDEPYEYTLEYTDKQEILRAMINAMKEADEDEKRCMKLLEENYEGDLELGGDEEWNKKWNKKGYERIYTSEDGMHINVDTMDTMKIAREEIDFQDVLKTIEKAKEEE